MEWLAAAECSKRLQVSALLVPTTARHVSFAVGSKWEGGVRTLISTKSSMASLEGAGGEAAEGRFEEDVSGWGLLFARGRPEDVCAGAAATGRSVTDLCNAKSTWKKKEKGKNNETNAL